MLKSHESKVENHWELCRMINHMVNDYVTLDIDLSYCKVANRGRIRELLITQDDSYDVDCIAH